MKVSDAMSRDVRVANPNQSIRDVASSMAQIDAGAIPVAENDRLIGMVTDRDIAIRGVAAGKVPGTPVREVMSPDIRYCYEDEDLKHVAQNMAELRVRRLPVLDRAKRLVGILSLGDIALSEKPKTSGETIAGVSQHGGPHSQ